MNNHFYKAFVLFLSVLSFVSCDKSDVGAEDIEMSSVRIVTRGAILSELDYPIFVYAFNSGGLLVTKQKIESADDELNLNLPSGNEYKIVALSADESVYDIPASPSLSSVVKIKDDCNSTLRHPLQMGFATIRLGSADANVNIQLNYQMCSLSASLHALPVQTSSPSITVSSCYEGVTLGGAFQGAKTATVKCDVESEGTFSSNETYIFPSAGSQTVFTIKYSDANGDQYSSATYNSSLSAGVPYIIDATHTGGLLAITGAITRPEWGEPVDISFTFGSNEDNEGDAPVIDGSYYIVNAIPSRFTTWNGHVIADVLNDNGTTATLLLLSLKEWDNMTSSTNETSPKLASNTANSYEEDGLDGWEIPNGTHAKLLYNAYQASDGGSTLAGVISSTEGADPLTLSVRYLCSSAAKTFSFSNSTVSVAGKTVTNYHLRLVREVQVKVGQ